MPTNTFVGCAKTDCKWNEQGACQKSEIFVDNGVRCASYEPGPGIMPQPGVPAGGAPDVRQMLLQRMAAGPTPMGAPGPTAMPMAPPGVPPRTL